MPLAELRRAAQPGPAEATWQAYTMKANSAIVMTGEPLASDSSHNYHETSVE